MAITTCKVTYSLPPDSVTAVDALAKKLHVPKSEIVRRGIDEMRLQQMRPKRTPLQALHALRKMAPLTHAEGENWKAEIRRERIASSRKRR